MFRLIIYQVGVLRNKSRSTTNKKLLDYLTRKRFMYYNVVFQSIIFY